ncbi:MAG: alanine dehydrogenase [Deinococcales bacterium]|nr:alanine dehydrogenase [Chitinophagaceae bacterium]
MHTIGLIREGKTPADNRVALTPQQCRWLQQKKDVKVVVQASPNRCFSNTEYVANGIAVVNDVAHCDILLGIKEVPISMLIPHKKYLFFSHTKKMQPYNQNLLKACISKGITLIDYECLEHQDGQRIIGFGFFAGVVGAHNALYTYGERTGLFHLPRVFSCNNYNTLIRHYFGLKLPNLKIALTGSGRVAQGAIDVMNLMGIIEVEPEDYLSRNFTYPVYVQLKGGNLYKHTTLKTYKRDHFHEHPTSYESCFLPYASCTDILINGVYWDTEIPRLFEASAINNHFVIQVIADITDDTNGSIPINLGDATIQEPIYGVDKNTHLKTAPFLPTSIDIMAVGNLPNELPRDASNYFGEQLLKYVLDDVLTTSSDIIDRATILTNGQLTPRFYYLKDYAK